MIKLIGTMGAIVLMTASAFAQVEGVQALLGDYVLAPKQNTEECGVKLTLTEAKNCEGVRLNNQTDICNINKGTVRDWSGGTHSHIGFIPDPGVDSKTHTFEQKTRTLNVKFTSQSILTRKFVSENSYTLLADGSLQANYYMDSLTGIEKNKCLYVKR